MCINFTKSILRINLNGVGDSTHDYINPLTNLKIYGYCSNAGRNVAVLLGLSDCGVNQEQEQEQDTVDCRSCYGNATVSVGKVHEARTGTANGYRPGYAVAISMEILLMLKYRAKPFLGF